MKTGLRSKSGARLLAAARTRVHLGAKVNQDLMRGLIFILWGTIFTLWGLIFILRVHPTGGKGDMCVDPYDEIGDTGESRT